MDKKIFYLRNNSGDDKKAKALAMTCFRKDYFKEEMPEYIRWDNNPLYMDCFKTCFFYSKRALSKDLLEYLNNNME